MTNRTIGVAAKTIKFGMNEFDNLPAEFRKMLSSARHDIGMSNTSITFDEVYRKLALYDERMAISAYGEDYPIETLTTGKKI